MFGHISISTEKVISIRMPETSARKYKVAFICTRNACRSQIAEALAKDLASDIIEPLSGGTDPSEGIDPGAVEAMKEIGIDISHMRPKRLPKEVLDSLDLVVHMGCGPPGSCMTAPGIPYEDWGLEDPAGKSLEEYRMTVREIERRVRDLASRLRSGRLPSVSASQMTFELSTSDTS